VGESGLKRLKMGLKRKKMNRKILEIIKKNMLLGIGSLKIILPEIQDIDNDNINGKHKLKKWLRMYI
jgi:hypothetical protein